MIVVDTNVIAYLYLPGEFTAAAESLCADDPEWAAPILWRSELRNVLATQVGAGHLALKTAQSMQDQAEQLLAGRDFVVDTARVLELAAESGCSAYDCEYIVLAEFLDVPLVSADRRLIESFPQYAKPLA